MNGVRLAAHHSNKPQRQPEVILHQEIDIVFGGGRNRAHMHHGVELAALEPAQQVAGRHEFGQPAFRQVAPLLPGAENIVDRDVGAPGLVQARDHIRANEAGPAGDQQHRRRITA